ncbi:hypothetical protein [Pasteurella testudinis]|uniref:hypothetical protein n=1 Tax=Pasteurella testudinis TaxID=761 RepID=UPI0009FBD06C|nr:hypothetical protein [Pasteurella testudinis]
MQTALDNVLIKERAPRHGYCAEIGCMNQADEAIKYFNIAYQEVKNEPFKDIVKNIGNFILKIKNNFICSLKI